MCVQSPGSSLQPTQQLSGSLFVPFSPSVNDLTTAEVAVMPFGLCACDERAGMMLACNLRCRSQAGSRHQWSHDMPGLVEESSHGPEGLRYL